MNNNLGCDLEYLLRRTTAQSSNESDDSRLTDWTVAAHPGKCCQTETKLDAPLQSKSSQTPEVQEATSVITCNAKAGSHMLKNSRKRSSNTEESHMPGSTDFVLLKKLKRAELLSQRMKTSDSPEIPVPKSETPRLAWTKVNAAPLDPSNTKCHP